MLLHSDQCILCEFVKSDYSLVELNSHAPKERVSCQAINFFFCKQNPSKLQREHHEDLRSTFTAVQKMFANEICYSNGNSSSRSELKRTFNFIYLAKKSLSSESTLRFDEVYSEP